MDIQMGKSATYNMTNFTIREMTQCGKSMRTIGEGAESLEEVAERIVNHFYDSLVDGKGERACSLVRFYKTHSYAGLDDELQDFARTMMGGVPASNDMKCLVLLATAGEEPSWNSRKTSRGHKAIPLPSEEAVNQAPMVSNLITQLGLSVSMVVKPDPEILLDMAQRTFNVFHVPKALGSPYIPAQKEFVIPYGIESVLGFGGLLPSGDMFVITLFLKIPVFAEVADLFKALSLNVKMGILPFEKRVFASTENTAASFMEKDTVAKGSIAITDIGQIISRVAALEELLEVYEKTAVEQAEKLYAEIAERKRAEEAIEERTIELAQANTRLKLEVKERKRAEEQLLHDAFHDSLTGLPNRALLLDRLGHAVDHWKRREDYILAVLILDIDHFKLINNSYEHSFGDELLVAIAQRIQGCVRSGDTVARLEGDEFCILLDDLPDVSEAALIAERIQKELKSPFHLKGKEIFITVSIGIAVSETKCERPEELLRDADTAMYRAKASGRARHEMFDKQMHIQVVRRLQMEGELRRAIEREEFLVYYQPVIALATDELVGFEALIRWQHPERGLVLPMDFIPLAEETGLIIPIGLWVLREACSRMRAWHIRFPSNPPLMVSVNLSGRQFAQSDLIEQIEEVIQATGLDAASLKLEITESVVMENAESAAVMLARLKELGIQLSIDDFGTGYSSLSYLSRFPIDMIKIDHSFVSRMHMGDENYEIVRTIVNLAHNLGRAVIAEGPETEEQVVRLKALGCEYGQGYYFARPLEKTAAENFIAGRNPA